MHTILTNFFNANFSPCLITDFIINIKNFAIKQIGCLLGQPFANKVSNINFLFRNNGDTHLHQQYYISESYYALYMHEMYLLSTVLLLKNPKSF